MTCQNLWLHTLIKTLPAVYNLLCLLHETQAFGHLMGSTCGLETSSLEPATSTVKRVPALLWSSRTKPTTTQGRCLPLTYLCPQTGQTGLRSLRKGKRPRPECFPLQKWHHHTRTQAASSLMLGISTEGVGGWSCSSSPTLLPSMCCGWHLGTPTLPLPHTAHGPKACSRE